MSMKTIPLSNPEGTRPQLSSVWSCSHDASIRDIVISRQGIVGVVTASKIHLYVGAPSFGASHTISTSPAHLTAYQFSTDGAHFFTGDSEGYVKWWEVHTGETIAATQFPFSKSMQDGSREFPPISYIVCSPNTELTAVSAGNTLCIYGREGLRLHSIGPLDAQIRSMQWKTFDELAVNIGTAICVIHVNDIGYTLGTKYPSEYKDGYLKILACSPKGNMFAAGCSLGHVQIWDLESETNGEISVILRELPNASTDSGSVACLEWDASSRFLAAAGGIDVVVWDTQDTEEKKDGRDNSFVCYGHGQKAKITALSFQPRGHLLATGGDDCQVLVFDSKTFTSGRVVGGLVDSIVSGKLTQRTSDSAITSLAWHPSGFILAGTTDGLLDAFEIPGAIYETPKATNGHRDLPFLIKRNDDTRKGPAGWGGQPLDPIKNGNGDIDKGNRRPGRGGSGTFSGNRTPGGRARVYMGNFKQNPRPSFAETVPVNGQWGSVMSWPYTHQQMPQPYGPRPTAPAPVYADMTAHHPRTPESIGSEPTARGAPPSNDYRNARQFNRSGSVEQVPRGMPPQMVPMGYMPYGPSYPVGYAPHGFYPYPMPQMPPEAMAGPMPAGMHPHHGPPPAMIPKVLHPPTPASAKPDGMRKDGSPDLEEDLGSKSSEATNNGVNNSVTPTQQSDASGYHPESQPQQGQTLYVGNLAQYVDETILYQYFIPYGPISNVQIIRDRETKISRGFGFVTYYHPMYAHTAMHNMDSVQIPGPFEGRKLKVSLSNRR